MNVKKASFTDEQRKEIQQAMKRPQTPHVYKRLMALKLKAIDGLRSDETGAYVGLHKSSVNLIVRRYQEQGIAAIIEKRHNHGNRYMSNDCLLYTSPSPRDGLLSRMPSSA